MVSLARALKEQGAVNNHLFKVDNVGSRDVICTAVAIFNPQNQYDGAGIVLRADLAGQKNEEPSLTEEQKALVESFLKRAGVHTNHEKHALKVGETYVDEEHRVLWLQEPPSA